MAGKANGKKWDRIKRFPVGESSKEHLLLQFYTMRCSSEAYLDGIWIHGVTIVVSMLSIIFITKSSHFYGTCEFIFIRC